MGTFQTLRELGYLPLVQVDADGYTREVGEGMGGTACPLEYDPVTKTPRPGTDCLKSGAEGGCLGWGRQVEGEMRAISCDSSCATAVAAHPIQL